MYIFDKMSEEIAENWSDEVAACVLGAYLGIREGPRLEESLEVFDLLAWMRQGVERLQREYPHEAAPAIQFVPDDPAPDFWIGAPSCGEV
jgi:hypothetical protein